MRSSIARSIAFASARRRSSLAGWACGGSEPPAPPVATPTLTLSHERAPAGSPLEMTYKFVVADGASFAEDYRVFVHVVDADEERMWSDDHNPPMPTSQWKPGQTIEYTRTIFVPVFPYIGDATINMGLHSLKTQPSGEQTRLPLAGEDVGQRAYRVARLELLPQTENLFTIFKDGWHPAELAGDSGGGRVAVDQEGGDARLQEPEEGHGLLPRPRQPGRELRRRPAGAACSSAGRRSTSSRSARTSSSCARSRFTPAQLGRRPRWPSSGSRRDKAIVPALTPEAASKDPRELGVRVFHAFVDPR